MLSLEHRIRSPLWVSLQSMISRKTILSQAQPSKDPFSAQAATDCILSRRYTL
jgi:hypothetical protein